MSAYFIGLVYAEILEHFQTRLPFSQYSILLGYPFVRIVALVIELCPL